MDKHIKSVYANLIPLEKIGKYDKFVEFKYNQENGQYELEDNLFTHFRTDSIEVDKFDRVEGHISLINMLECLEKKIISEIQHKIDIEHRKFLSKKINLINKALKKSKEYTNLQKSILKYVDKINLDSLAESSTS